MTWQSELRAWAVASAAVFCLSAIGYRVMTAPAVPDLAPSVAKLNSALQELPGTLSHVQSTSDAATGLLRAASPAVTKLSDSAGKLGDAVDLTSHRLNDLCPPATAVDAALHPCGTLADANRTLATFRGTTGQIERSLLVFNQHEADLFGQEQTAYAGMNKAVGDFDTLVGDPDLRATFHNGATISGNFATMTTDSRDWLHGKLYPTKRKGFISGFEATGDVLKHWEPPLF